MDTLAGNVVMTGGVVAYNPFLVKIVEEGIGQKVWVPQVIAGSINAPQAHKSNPYRPAPKVRYVLKEFTR